MRLPSHTAGLEIGDLAQCETIGCNVVADDKTGIHRCTFGRGDERWFGQKGAAWQQQPWCKSIRLSANFLSGTLSRQSLLHAVLLVGFR
jgi:hypothetical protein